MSTTLSEQMMKLKAELREKLFAKNSEFIEQVRVHNHRVRRYRAQHGTPTPAEDDSEESDSEESDSADDADDYWDDSTEKNPVILAWKDFIRTIIDFLVVSCQVANIDIPDELEMREHQWKLFTKLEKQRRPFATKVFRSQIHGHNFLTKDETLACCNAVQYESNLRSEGIIRL